MVGQHEARVEDAAVVDAPPYYLGDGGTDDLVHQTLVEHIVHRRHGRIRTHAARVGPLVAVEDALVVLGGSKRQNLVAAHDREKRQFLTLEILLYENHVGRVSETPHHEAFRQGRLRLRKRLSNHHPFAGGQAVGLDHNGRPMLVQVGQGRAMFGEDIGVRSRHPGRLHDLLRESLGTLDPRPGGPGAEDDEAPVPQLVGKTGHERCFGAHHGKVDLLPLHKGDQGRDIARVDRH